MRLSNLISILCIVPSMATASGQTIEEIRSPIPLAGKPIPRFQNGVLPVIEMDQTTLSIVDRTGRTSFTGALSIPDAAVTAIRSVAVAPDGNRIVAAITAKSSSGQLSAGLVFLKSDGTVTSIVRTNPFHIKSIVFDDRGRLAALGMAADAQWKEIPVHNVLRYYDSNGSFLSEALPVGSARVNGEHPAWGGELLARPGGVAIMIRKHAALIEIDSVDPAAARTRDFSFLVSDKRNVVGLGYDKLGQRVLAMSSEGHSDFFELSTGDDLRVRRRLALRLPADVQGGLLIGTDGDRLVVLASRRVFIVPKN